MKKKYIVYRRYVSSSHPLRISMSVVFKDVCSKSKSFWFFLIWRISSIIDLFKNIVRSPETAIFVFFIESF